MAARNENDLKELSGRNHMGLDPVVERLSAYNLVIGNVVLGATAYHYGGIRGLVAYSVVSGITNLSAILEGND